MMLSHPLGGGTAFVEDGGVEAAALEDLGEEL
jgi:hypothetical protein